jgi:diguanylate cyclase (GGDEF)-like protein/PAS domain S-box-containing protein
MNIHSGVYGLWVGGILSLGWGIARLILGSPPPVISDVALVGAGLLQLYLVRRWPRPSPGPRTPALLQTLTAERYRLFVENFQGIAFHGDLDTMRPILLGGQVRQITGYEPEEFLAGRVDLFRLLLRRDLPRVRQEMRRLLQDPEHSVDIEFRIRPKGGGERWVRLVATRAATAGGHRFIQGAIYDIHQRKEAEAAALRSEALLRQIGDTIQDVVLLVDQEGTIRYATPSAEAVLGFRPAQMQGRSALEYLSPEVYGKVVAGGKRGNPLTLEFQHRRPDGRVLWLEVRASYRYDPQGRLSGMVVGVRDIDERKRQQAYVEFMAFHDELTQLPNRRALKQQAEQALEVARSSGQPLALLYFDLDNFKAVNDTLGHDAGDELLVEIATLLSRQLRPGDLLARLGGDEFACLLPGTDPEQARQVAIRMSRAVRGTFTLREQEVALGMSVGVACFPHDGQSFVELLKASDIAMYQAKESGSRVVVYEAGKSPYTHERLRLEASLREAVEQHAFEFYYQPFLHLSDGTVHEAEALLRWRNRGQVVNAADFIPLAEETGLIGHIDQATFSLALWQLVRWQQQGLPYRLSLNLSAQSVARKGALTELNHLVQHGGLEPHRLTLEITESALLHDSEEVRSALLELKALGVRLAMDDFGSGYASLAYLRRLPLDRIKIDRSFITHLGSSRRDEKLVRAAIDLGHSLEAEVLAEGVETLEQLRWLRENGCDLVQGNLIGLPAPLEAWYPSPVALGRLHLALAPRRPSPMG